MELGSRFEITPRHRICSCMTDGDDWIGFGKPIRCIKGWQVVVVAQQDQQIVECLAGCGHRHLYSDVYLLRMRLAEHVNRLGLEKAIAILAEGQW